MLLNRYLKSNKHNLIYEREERIYDSLKCLGKYSDEEIETKYVSEEYFEFLNKWIRNLDSKDNEARICEYELWKDAAMKNPQSVAKDAMNFIDASIFEHTR